MHELLVSRSGHLCQVVDPNVAGVLIIKTEKSTQNNITCVGTIIFDNSGEKNSRNGYELHKTL